MTVFRLRRGVIKAIVSSPLSSSRTRISMLRRYGLQVQAQRIDERCFFGGRDIVLGHGTVIGARCVFDNTETISVGRDTVLGPRVMIITSAHDFGPRQRRSGKRVSAPVTLGEGCHIGAGTTILAGVRIGDGCVVRGGSLVLEPLESRGVYAGSPARRVGDLSEH